MPFDIPQNDSAPPVQPFDVALKELVEALGEAPAAQALVEGGRAHARRCKQWSRWRQHRAELALRPIRLAASACPTPGL